MCTGTRVPGPAMLTPGGYHSQRSLFKELVNECDKDLVIDMSVDLVFRKLCVHRRAVLRLTARPEGAGLFKVKRSAWKQGRQTNRGRVTFPERFYDTYRL